MNSRPTLDDGLQPYLDEYYMYRGKIRLGGYGTFTKMVAAGRSDQLIGQHFGRSRQTIHDWRKIHEREQAHV